LQYFTRWSDYEIAGKTDVMIETDKQKTMGRVSRMTGSGIRKGQGQQ
jgi:hypothetical protein